MAFRLPLIAVLACGGTPAPPGAEAAYLAALALAAETPGRAWEACLQVGEQSLRTDCAVAAMEALARDRRLATPDLLARCQALETPLAREECAFQLAERRNDAAACAEAGGFADDCRLHIFSDAFPLWVPAGATPGGAAEAEAEARLRAVGLALDDPRPWSAWYRWVLGSHETLDRRTCAAVEAPARREACGATGLALYRDRLRQARDQGVLCHPTLPPNLLPGDDAELGALLAQARSPCP